jgi:hypothetical protein
MGGGAGITQALSALVSSSLKQSSTVSTLNGCLQG